MTNSAKQRVWRMNQIAFSAIYKMFPSAQIIESKTNVYDFDVFYVDSTEMHIGVVIKSSTFINSQLYEQTIDNLRNELTMPHVPIIILCINESAEEVRFGYLVSWAHGRYYINYNLKLHTLNSPQRKVLLENIKSMDETIRVLSTGQAYCVKTICTEIACGHQNTNVEFKYLRQLSVNYKMHSTHTGLSMEQRFWRLINGIPQEEFPHDELDSIIVKCIQSKYPQTQTKSSLMILSNELRDIKRYQQYRRYPLFCRVGLDISRIPIHLLNTWKDVIQYQIPMELYIDSHFDVPALQNQILTDVIPIDEWQTVLSYINNNIQTLRLISTYFD